MTETTQEAFERGATAGRIEQRLTEHEDHLLRINGSIERGAAATEDVAKELNALHLAVQSLADSVASERAVEEARREESDYAWTPLQRVVVGFVTLLVVGALVIAARGGR